MSEGYKSNWNVLSPCHYHVGWCPKWRRKVLLPPIEERLKQMIRGVCEEHQAEIEALEVMPDHVRRYGERRSPIWHSSPDEVGQGPFLSSLASGVSDVEAEAANIVAEFVCLCNHRGRTTLTSEAVP
jgi:hypothetical protein